MEVTFWLFATIFLYFDVSTVIWVSVQLGLQQVGKWSENRNFKLREESGNFILGLEKLLF